MGKQIDPNKQLHVDLVGHDTYAAVWKSMPWYSRLYWTIRGENPGGRKGAPPLEVNNV